MGCKPKGGADGNRLPFNSQSAFLRLTYGSRRCHSCRKLNYLATVRHAHNPKVEGSNPSPATKTSSLSIISKTIQKWRKRVCYQTATKPLEMRPYPYLSSFSSREADAALSMRAERLISRMFSPIATNQIGKSDTRDRAAGWSQRRRLFGAKTQRAARFEVASTKALVPQATGLQGLF